MKPLIDLRNVSKTYWLGETEVKAVSGISLPIYRQEYLSILGASGSGKSTLMYLIGLLEIPSRGKISFNGRDVSKLADAKLSHLRNGSIGFVFQQFNLINKFTVLENVILPTRYSKTRLKFNPKNKARQLLKDFGILDRQDFFPNKISGGQQQRVAIARALLTAPRLLLMDEPLASLDQARKEEILPYLERL
ncbi:TPA: lipoprotein-releasing system ATP-binding protein LolD, partial [Candidatus Beckwithbacteria bacterium]|nr:lipoprotein-releasing system ATP-binding protein LolD [Candidatus Beckwithbacteria bacterium]